MGHCINGFIALEKELRAATLGLHGGCVCPLSIGYAFLPFLKAFVSEDDLVVETDALYQLTVSMAEWAQAHSIRFPIAYIETDYFGGLGGQSSIVWNAGQIVFGPVHTDESTPLLDGAINLAARYIEISRGSATDEFDALGLGRYRANEDWAVAALKQAYH